MIFTQETSRKEYIKNCKKNTKSCNIWQIDDLHNINEKEKVLRRIYKYGKHGDILYSDENELYCINIFVLYKVGRTYLYRVHKKPSRICNIPKSITKHIRNPYTFYKKALYSNNLSNLPFFILELQLEYQIHHNFIEEYNKNIDIYDSIDNSNNEQKI